MLVYQRVMWLVICQLDILDTTWVWECGGSFLLSILYAAVIYGDFLGLNGIFHNTGNKWDVNVI
jgi:hypothetical protein